MTSIVLARQGANVVSVSNEALNCQTVTNAILAEGLEGIAHVADCTKGGRASWPRRWPSTAAATP